jgi:hypothetical protein
MISKMQTDNHRQFTLKLIDNAKAELSLAIQSKNYEREDYLRARIRAYEQILGEQEND